MSICQVRFASISVIAAYRALAEFSDSELDRHYKKEFLDTATRTRAKDNEFLPTVKRRLSCANVAP